MLARPNWRYPENTNFEPCASRILKLHVFGGLYTTKQCWICELDILSVSGVMDAQNI